jgi:hypothetical protein
MRRWLSLAKQGLVQTVEIIPSRFMTHYRARNCGHILPPAKASCGGKPSPMKAAAVAILQKF